MVFLLWCVIQQGIICISCYRYTQAPGVLQAYYQNLGQSHVDTGTNVQEKSQDKTRYEQKKKIGKEVMLIVGILIATLSFQALMSPPDSTMKDGRIHGKSSIFFMACNSISFFASCFGIYVSLREDPTMILFWVSSSLVWTAASYVCVLISVLNKKHVAHDLLITSIAMAVPNMIVSLIVYSESIKKIVKKIKRYAQG